MHRVHSKSWICVVCGFSG
uniref:Uncharacterized protein n=1 Tax=Anguilla anguilla TaxID=7936 RepID=A0A0E9TTF2_ANGAN